MIMDVVWTEGVTDVPIHRWLFWGKEAGLLGPSDFTDTHTGGHFTHSTSGLKPGVSSHKPHPPAARTHGPAFEMEVPFR